MNRIAVSHTGAVELLYDRLAEPLERLVGRNVAAPDWLIEDACQIAWTRLCTRRDEVREGSEFGWLYTTATRAALHMARAREREMSLERSGGQGEGAATVLELPERAPGPEHVAELRERLAEMRALPVRQRRAVWLQAIGYDYVEIAERTGDSRRTVERQLLRARSRLRALPA